VSAREDLEKWAARYVSGVETLNFDHLLGAALTEARREAAHEAAEKQRNAAHIARLLGMTAEEAARAVADLIDPEVET
jgi:hypothetical protein